MLFTLSLPMLRVQESSAGNAIPREALEVFGAGGKMDVGAGIGERMEKKRRRGERVWATHKQQCR